MLTNTSSEEVSWGLFDTLIDFKGYLENNDTEKWIKSDELFHFTMRKFCDNEYIIDDLKKIPFINPSENLKNIIEVLSKKNI